MTVYVILRVVDNLKTILAPILPHTAQRLREYLGYEGQPFGSARGRLFGTQQVVEYQEEARHGGLRSHQALTYDHSGAVGAWSKSELSPGQALREPAHAPEQRGRHAWRNSHLHPRWRDQMPTGWTDHAWATLFLMLRGRTNGVWPEGAVLLEPRALSLDIGSGQNQCPILWTGQGLYTMWYAARGCGTILSGGEDRAYSQSNDYSSLPSVLELLHFGGTICVYSTHSTGPDQPHGRGSGR
jgi:hypothetical protein